MLAADLRFRAQNTSPDNEACGTSLVARSTGSGSITRRGVIMKKAFWLAGGALLALVQPPSAGDTIKSGFVSTFSGPTAVIGNDMRNSFELALDHLGRKMGGKPVEVIYDDDAREPGG